MFLFGVRRQAAALLSETQERDKSGGKPPHSKDYSYRSAISGSTLVARRAGM